MHPQDDIDVYAWLRNAAGRGGSFVKHLALAALYADPQNYPILHPVILVMKEKYPYYNSPLDGELP